MTFAHPSKRYLDIEYSPNRDNGRIEVRKGKRTLHSFSTRPSREGVQYLRFETSALAANESEPLELIFSNASLRCFDVRASDE
jgi:hypothetical protein